MGCVNTKIQDDNQTYSSKNNNTDVEDNIDFKLNRSTNKVVDLYDLPYKGKDSIL